MQKGFRMTLTIRGMQRKLKKLWSSIIRNRDGYKCQWCGKVSNKNHAHHIVAKSLSNPLGFYDLRNGMTLCYRCHIFRLKSETDEYIELRDVWLKKRKLNYGELRQEFGKKVKLFLDDYLVIFHKLKKVLLEQEDGDNNIYTAELPKLSSGKERVTRTKRKTKRNKH